MATSYLEDMIIKFLDKKLTDEEKRQIHSSYDCEKEIDEETEEEMKTALFQFVFNGVKWWKVIDAVKADLESESESSSDEEED